MLALPLIVLFEVGLLAARFFVPKPTTEEPEPENGAAS
jgi:sec-independent protein translocase protein TatC